MRRAITKEEKEAEKEQKRQEKEEEKEQKRREKEAEKAAKAASKIPARAIRGMVTSKGSPIAATAVVKAKVMKTVASSSSSTPLPTMAVTPKPAVKAIAKPVAPAKKEDWVPPAKGKSKDFTLNGVTYLRDHLDRLWTKDANGKPDECAGWYDVANNKIDDENVPEDD